MSKLIVEMPMPTRCGVCKCRHVEFDIDRVAVFCEIKDYKYVEDPDSRPSWCPIKGVLPEQHGDLVDADTVLWGEEVPDSEGIVVPVTIGDVIEGYDVQIVIAAERKDDGTTAD